MKLEVKDLRKSFGETEVLHGVSFSVESGRALGMLGALVSKTEDISKSSSPVLMLYIASFMIAIFGMTSDSNSILMKVASYIPFTSGHAMFIRVSMGSVAVWEVIISAIILGVSCVVAGVLAAKIFRFGTLHYGNPIKFKTALRKVKKDA